MAILLTLVCFEKLQIVPLMIVSPLTFLGGAFYSIEMLPPAWRTIALFNPVVYLVNGFPWTFYGVADVSVAISLGMTIGFLIVCVGVIAWNFKTGALVADGPRSGRPPPP
jgi:ABC-2 type transport system permease protein